MLLQRQVAGEEDSSRSGIRTRASGSGSQSHAQPQHHGANESRVCQGPVGAKHFHLQSQDLQGHRRPKQVGRTLDLRDSRRPLLSGDSHHLHLSNEIRQVPARHAALQVSGKEVISRLKEFIFSKAT